jgi:hypothetical protein
MAGMKGAVAEPDAVTAKVAALIAISIQWLRRSVMGAVSTRCE